MIAFMQAQLKAAYARLADALDGLATFFEKHGTFEPRKVEAVQDALQARPLALAQLPLCIVDTLFSLHSAQIRSQCRRTLLPFQHSRVGCGPPLRV